MAKTNQKGFGLIEGIMAVVIVLLVIAVVYLFVQANQKKDQDKAVSSTSQTASPSPSPSVADEQSAALAQVKNFYKKWVSDEVVMDQRNYPTSQWLKDGYVTQAAVDQEEKYPQFDSATCSQNPLKFDEYTFGTPTITGNTGTIAISGVYSGIPGDTPTTLRYTFGLVKDGSIWKINAFNCPSSNS